MKTFKTSFLLLLFFSFTTIGFTQAKTETFKVAGECGMCKKKIEAGAKRAGASYANWNVDTKLMTVKYNSTSTNKAKIEKAIATTGYDTPGYKATSSAYESWMIAASMREPGRPRPVPVPITKIAQKPPA